VNLQLQIPGIAGLPKHLTDTGQVVDPLSTCLWSDKENVGARAFHPSRAFLFGDYFKREGDQDVRIKKVFFLPGIWKFEGE